MLMGVLGLLLGLVVGEEETAAARGALQQLARVLPVGALPGAVADGLHVANLAASEEGGRLVDLGGHLGAVLVGLDLEPARVLHRSRVILHLRWGRREELTALVGTGALTAHVTHPHAARRRRVLLGALRVDHLREEDANLGLLVLGQDDRTVGQLLLSGHRHIMAGLSSLGRLFVRLQGGLDEPGGRGRRGQGVARELLALTLGNGRHLRNALGLRLHLGVVLTPKTLGKRLHLGVVLTRADSDQTEHDSGNTNHLPVVNTDPELA